MPEFDASSGLDDHDAVNDSLITLTKIIYGLQAVGIVFTIGLLLIAAVILNYVKLDDVKGTWLESHYRWQIRTFWYGLLWGIIAGITIFIYLGFIILFANGIWIIYRIIKGWLQLIERKIMYPN